MESAWSLIFYRNPTDCNSQIDKGAEIDRIELRTRCRESALTQVVRVRDSGYALQHISAPLSIFP